MCRVIIVNYLCGIIVLDQVKIWNLAHVPFFALSLFTRHDSPISGGHSPLFGPLLLSYGYIIHSVFYHFHARAEATDRPAVGVTVFDPTASRRNTARPPGLMNAKRVVGCSRRRRSPQGDVVVMARLLLLLPRGPWNGCGASVWCPASAATPCGTTPTWEVQPEYGQHGRVIGGDRHGHGVHRRRGGRQTKQTRH